MQAKSHYFTKPFNAWEKSALSLYMAKFSVGVKYNLWESSQKSALSGYLLD